MMVYNIDSINSFWIIISAKFPGTAHEHELTLFTPHDAKTVWVCGKVHLKTTRCHYWVRSLPAPPSLVRGPETLAGAEQAPRSELALALRGAIT